MEGVNKPELLPQGDFTTVIDVAGFLTTGEVGALTEPFDCTAACLFRLQRVNHDVRVDMLMQEARIREQVSDLEKDTGIKLRVLAQNYPETPGLAIKVRRIYVDLRPCCFCQLL